MKKQYLYMAIIMIANILGIMFLWKMPLLLTLLTIIIGIFILFLERRFVFYFSIIILGTIFDTTAVHLGIWQFALPTLGLIPLWLPFSYANFFSAILLSKNN